MKRSINYMYLLTATLTALLSIPAAHAMEGERKRNNALEASLLEACRNGDVATAEKAIMEGADVNERDLYPGHSILGATPLIHAIYNGHINVAELLLRHKADANKEGMFGGTPLVRAQTSQCAELLIAHKADVNQLCCGNTDSPLLSSIAQGYLEIAKILLMFEFLS